MLVDFNGEENIMISEFSIAVKTFSIDASFYRNRDLVSTRLVFIIAVHASSVVCCLQTRPVHCVRGHMLDKDPILQQKLV